MPADAKRVADRWLEAAGKPKRSPFFEPLEDVQRRRQETERPFNPWTAPPGAKRPAEPEKGTYEAYVARKKREGEKWLSKEEWEKAKKRHRFPID